MTSIEDKEMMSSAKRLTFAFQEDCHLNFSASTIHELTELHFAQIKNIYKKTKESACAML